MDGRPSDKPLLSVCCIAYNHEKFIAQALDGFLMQKTSFPFEIIVNDDCSTDRTPEILKEYALKHPSLVKPVFQRENQYSKGVDVVQLVIERASGDYIAFCEGDDYWTSPDKLQRQVEALEADPTLSGCFHPMRVYLEKEGRFRDSLLIPATIKPRYSLDDILDYRVGPFNIAQCGSLAFRRKPFITRPHFSVDGIGDIPLHALNALSGDYAFIPEPLGVHRKHEGGVTGGWSLVSRRHLLVNMTETVGERLGFKSRPSYQEGLAYLKGEIRAHSLSAVGAPGGLRYDRIFNLTQAFLECRLMTLGVKYPRLALFPAGLHTEWLLRVMEYWRLIRKKPLLPMPEIVALVDEKRREPLEGRLVLSPEKLDFKSIDAIVVSSDGASAALMARAYELGLDKKPLFQLYDEYDPAGSQPDKSWAAASKTPPKVVDYATPWKEKGASEKA